MSTRELTRAGVLARVAAGTLTLGSAATVMAVSYRQAKRLYRRYRAEGARGVKHRGAGRRSNAARAEGARAHVLALIREKYSGGVDERFGPTLTAEHLASERRAGASRHATAMDAGGRPVESRAEAQSAPAPARADGACRRAGAARWQLSSVV